MEHDIAWGNERQSRLDSSDKPDDKPDDKPEDRPNGKPLTDEPNQKEIDEETARRLREALEKLKGDKK